MAGHDTAATTHAQNSSNSQSVGTAVRRGALGIAPIGAAIAMFVHPHAGDEPYEAIAATADAWLLVHVVLFASLALLGVGVYLLADRVTGLPALLGKAGAAIFTAFYGGYVAMVGLSSGLIVRAGQGLPAEQQAGIDAALVYLLQEPAVMAVAGVGAVGFLIAAIATAVGYRRQGASPMPLALLFGAVVALGIHSGPIAVAGMLTFLVGAVWLESVDLESAGGADDGI